MRHNRAFTLVDTQTLRNRLHGKDGSPKYLGSGIVAGDGAMTSSLSGCPFTRDQGSSYTGTWWYTCGWMGGIGWPNATNQGAGLNREGKLFICRTRKLTLSWQDARGPDVYDLQITGRGWEPAYNDAKDCQASNIIILTDASGGWWGSPNHGYQDPATGRPKSSNSFFLDGHAEFRPASSLRYRAGGGGQGWY